ncbi:hypothetical protein IP88_14960 [alpha proteobacterium AAP81b]|nr:hypothetical protein IP88_14960 [alpha proteobacterium AAP81b]
MTFGHGLRRLALASVLCAVSTSATLVPLAIFSGSFLGIAALILFIPVVALYYAAGLLAFGLPLLWAWPKAFLRGPRRAIAAAVIGGGVVGLGFAIATGWEPLSSVEGMAGATFLLLCGTLAGVVWWWLNFDAAPD